MNFSHSHSLHGNQRKVAMSRNLHPAPNCDAVERTLPLKATEYPLDRLSLLVKGFPLWSLNGFPKFRCELLVSFIGLDYGHGSVLPLDEVSNWLPRIPLVGDDMLGVESRVGEASFREQMRRSLGIVDVSRTNVGCYRHLIFRINGEVKLPAQRKLSFAMSVLLNTPSRLRIRRFALATIDPTFERATVDSNSLPEPRESGIMPSHKSTGHILNKVKEF